uniref:Heparan-sulfate 6-O-sulfotransferase n=1 Tax=Ficedula albicollis TaxID=59894 RepID=A0A803W2I2_FICAL
MRGRDVIVFLHIQKTGGTTFGRHLVRNIHLEQPCYCRAGQKKCACHRPGGDKDTWLFSRFSTGWSCGLHADWTELTSCVPAAMERRGCAGNRTLRSVPAFPMLQNTSRLSRRRGKAPWQRVPLPAPGRELSAAVLSRKQAAGQGWCSGGGSAVGSCLPAVFVTCDALALPQIRAGPT